MDLAQALWKVRHTRSPEETARFVNRLRVYQTSWQDTGTVWIWNNFPDLFLIQATWLYAGLFNEGDASLHDESWVRANLLEGHGPLGAAYPPANAHGKTAINVKEGDSCTFFHLLAPGLSDPEHPEWGGWGGRFQPFSEATRFYVDGSDRHPSSDDPVRQRQWTLGRWNEARANEFAARMDWCVRSVAEANHPPVVSVEGDASRRVLERRVASGNHVSLTAEGTTDPDGNALDYHWWHYAEPGSYSGSLELQGQNTPRLSFVAPVVTEPQTIHLVLAVTDRGEPRLTSYRRVVFTVLPADCAFHQRNAVAALGAGVVCGKRTPPILLGSRSRCALHRPGWHHAARACLLEWRPRISHPNGLSQARGLALADDVQRPGRRRAAWRRPEKCE